MDHLPAVSFNLPDWIDTYLNQAGNSFPTVQQRMSLAIGLARQNIEQGTGGPFGAAVFSSDGALLAPGVNIVVASRCSVLHAEIVALMMAQKLLGRFDISDSGLEKFELVTSTEPCAMCFGAIPWSGVSSVVAGARDEDARAIGFDEGPKPADWAAELRKRGIEVTTDILREQAAAVLNDYAGAGGNIYNSGA